MLYLQNFMVVKGCEGEAVDVCISSYLSINILSKMMQ